jgi:NADH-quinone oxidoreductase subunit I
MAQTTMKELVWDVLYGARSLVEGMRVTLYNLVFRARVTDQYPHRDPKDDYHPGPGYRGMLGLVTDAETGQPHCTACGQCEKICPDRCIRVVGEGKGKERRPAAFTIDMALCMYCGLCTEVCPFDAITMTPKYTGAVERVTELRWELERLRQEGDRLPHISRVEAAAGPEGHE